MVEYIKNGARIMHTVGHFSVNPNVDQGEGFDARLRSERMHDNWGYNQKSETERTYRNAYGDVVSLSRLKVNKAIRAEQRR